MAKTIGLTSFSVAVAARVVRKIGEITKGTDPHADQAFEIVAKVLEELSSK